MLGYGQQAGGTHPTGMHSCSTDEKAFVDPGDSHTDRDRDLQKMTCVRLCGRVHTSPIRQCHWLM